MTLMIVKADGIEFMTCRIGDCHTGTAVETAGEKDNRFFPHSIPSHPRSEAMAAAISEEP